MRDVFSINKKHYLIECYYYKDFKKWVPKCISNKTKMFRYYSCTFNLRPNKINTARA